MFVESPKEGGELPCDYAVDHCLDLANRRRGGLGSTMTADARPVPPPLGRGDRFTVSTMRSTLRRAAVTGVYGAVVFGVLHGIEARSVGRGLIDGVFFDVLSGAMTPRLIDRKVQRTPQWASLVHGLFAAATAGVTLVLWTLIIMRVARRRAAAIAKADRAEAAALAVLGTYNTGQ